MVDKLQNPKQLL